MFGSFKQCSKFAQDRPHRAGVGAHEFQGQGDQFVIAFGHLLQHQVLQHAQVATAQHLVGTEVFAVSGVDAGGVDTDETNAQIGQPLQRLRVHAGQPAVPCIAGVMPVSAHQHPRWQAGIDGVGQQTGEDIARDGDLYDSDVEARSVDISFTTADLDEVVRQFNKFLILNDFDAQVALV